MSAKEEDYIVTGMVFAERVTTYPDWANHPTRKIRVVSHANCEGLPITGIGPNVSFEGTNSDGESASFAHCEHLKIARGKFRGSVDFTLSGVEEIQDLAISKADVYGKAAGFTGCPKLKLATGNYPGAVDFSDSGVEEIKDLVITDTDAEGDSAWFFNCTNLKTATGKFPGAVCFDSSGIEKVKNLEVTPSIHGWMASISGTPLEAKNPAFAAEMLTGTANPKTWEKIAKSINLQEDMLNHTRKEVLMRAVSLVKLKAKDITLEM